jgi:hypothetical protein
MDGQVKKTPAALVALAWLFVGLPWTWGVTQLWKNARKLFQTPPVATQPAPATSAGSGSTPAAPSSK